MAGVKGRDITGNRYGRLVVVAESSRASDGSRRWEAVCDCGEAIVTRQASLASGNTKSCGCLHMDLLMKRTVTHGRSKTPEYALWRNMRQRCQNPSFARYKDYGGRGISVCDRWNQSFEDFIEDVGLRPSPNHSLDRIDNAGNYEPGNCQWATRTMQQSNTRRNWFVQTPHETITVSEYARRFGVTRDVIMWRAKKWGEPIIGNVIPEAAITNFKPTKIGRWGLR